jgi:hypothetical protein
MVFCILRWPAGTVHAAVVTHAHSTFQRMQILPAHSADDHLMPAVRDGMRSALYQHQFATPFAETYGVEGSNKRKYSVPHNFLSSSTLASTESMGDAEVTATAEAKAHFDRFFDIPVGGVHRYFPAAGTGPTLRSPALGAVAEDASELMSNVSAEKERVSTKTAASGYGKADRSPRNGASPRPPRKVVSFLPRVVSTPL